ncbi:hypothetical protein ACI1US_00021 [Leucobacter sp. BZR 635]
MRLHAQRDELALGHDLAVGSPRRGFVGWLAPVNAEAAQLPVGGAPGDVFGRAPQHDLGPVALGAESEHLVVFSGDRDELSRQQRLLHVVVEAAADEVAPLRLVLDKEVGGAEFVEHPVEHGAGGDAEAALCGLPVPCGALRGLFDAHAGQPQVGVDEFTQQHAHRGLDHLGAILIGFGGHAADEFELAQQHGFADRVGREHHDEPQHRVAPRARVVGHDRRDGLCVDREELAVQHHVVTQQVVLADEVDEPAVGGA